ncbi:EscU/YscU/HrcU family type III secretion system export apparatus switch protein [uncultured Helicobacter sp.]|uniref:EscU/YscU/HrcU family type III secretion system export apparatus switch protein n=1 Tax=uncultured Helicobacter sp. TaxID=175537 RepID=UPI001F8C2EDF|nr:EscU/YscU/HrcU family type III secretion system export apparatus switch protein [uncultured Helicobacter sp.]HIY43706.1 EscU/YscU/HrcU family type III secretion system export apparatus switch protein [Candidatus Helicobacter avistercoris]
MKKAAALAYNQAIHNAPQVVASGKGAIAQSIISKAKEFNIPLFQNQVLVDSLLKFEVDEEVSSDLYSALVEVFIWLHECEKKAQLSGD